MAARILLALLFTLHATVAGAGTVTFQALIDSDAVHEGQCTQSVGESGVSALAEGIDYRFTVTVDDVAARVLDSTLEACDGDRFGVAAAAGEAVFGPLDQGAAFIEAALPLDELGAPAGVSVVGLVQAADGGSDLWYRSSTAGGGGARVVGHPLAVVTAVPLLGPLAAVVLAALLALAVWRRPGALVRVLPLLLLLTVVGGGAWAAGRLIDGDPSDWSGTATAVDARGDATAGTRADLTAGWLAADAGYLYMRVDLARPEVDAEDVRVIEGDSGTTDAVFALSLSHPAGSELEVSYATADGDARTASGDYAATRGSVRFAPGESVRSVPVVVFGDTLVEDDETFTLAVEGQVATATIVNDDTTELSIADIEVPEGASGVSDAVFTATLSRPSAKVVTADYRTIDLGASAAQGDYAATSGVLSFAPGQVSRTIAVPIYGDETVEGPEFFLLALENVVGAVGGAAAVATIVPDEALVVSEAQPPLNDTGIVACADAFATGLACPVAGYPGQDAEQGRDVADGDGTDGRAGFSFTKLDASGSALPAGAADWRCVRDGVSGLTWEVKTDDGGLHDRDHTYTWYNADPETNGGSAGWITGGVCGGDACDTYSFIRAVNAAGLCGQHDWRLPNRQELYSLLDFGGAMPPIDSGYFPNTREAYYLTVSPFSVAGSVWVIQFAAGAEVPQSKRDAFRVRLVRGGINKGRGAR